MSYVKSDALCTPRHQQVCQCITCAPVGSSFYQCGNAELPLEKLPLAEMILEGCQPKVLTCTLAHKSPPMCTGQACYCLSAHQCVPAACTQLLQCVLQCAQLCTSCPPVSSNVHNSVTLVSSVCTIQACHW